jgi:hypothetical protein
LQAVAFAAGIWVFANPLFKLRDAHPLGLIHFQAFLDELFGLF